MELPLRRPFDPDWRNAALPGRRLLFAVTRALAGSLPSRDDGGSTTVDPLVGPPADVAIVARVTRRGRTLEVICVGGTDVVEILAPIAARFGAELLIRHVDHPTDPVVRACLARGGVVVAGSVRQTAAAGLAHAAA
jgi:hypothetical protein